MPDRVIELLSAYALETPDRLDDDVRHEVTRLVLDDVGIALGSLQEPAVRATRRYVYDNYAGGPSLVWGTGLRSLPQAAALANGTAVRTIDYNDGFVGRDAGHPSDVIPGLVAFGERCGSSGNDVAVAVALVYDVIFAMFEAMYTRQYGWDHIGIQAVSACCGFGRLMGLDHQQMGNALGITAVAHNALLQTRSDDELTMWKSVASSYSLGNAMEACLLARAGVEGPSRPFDGHNGYIEVLARGDFDWSALDQLQGRPRRILDTNIKMWPLGQLAQGSVDVAVALHGRIERLDDIANITIHTSEVAAEIMDGPAKWNPTTRETADHSLVYSTVAGLYDGTVDHHTFREDRLESSGFKQILRDKVKLIVRDDYTASFPENQPARVEVTMTDGTTLVEECTHPRGHARNRATDEDLAAKFDRLVVPVLGAEESAGIREVIGGFPDAPRITDLTDRLVL